MAWIFGRPEYDISFHVNTDSADLIGTDTFINNEVRLRKGSIYQCAEFGGFGILDEINMAKNDAVSVLHATLDHRRRINIPGYNRILLHPATRFIGTMNYGYAGTRELNEALVSRFMVIDMPEMDEDSVLFVLRQHFPDGEKSALKAFAGLFLDLQIKAYHGEISTKSLDLRGLVSAVKATRSGLSPIDAIQMGIINKSFDVFEKEIVEDVVSTRIPSSWTGKDIWGKLVWRMSDGRRNNWKNIIWRSAIVSEIFFGQSVVIMIRNLNRIQKNMFIQNKRFCMRQ